MLLIIEALLLILAALGQDHRAAAEGQVYPLDMALNSVDDLYYGCTEKMAKLVEKKYLKKELSNCSNFRKAWEMGEKNVTRNWNIFSKFKKRHKIAIWVYTQYMKNFTIHDVFNKDTRSGKQNYTVIKYKWYSLHFLLTEALYILKKTQERCFITYRGGNTLFNGTLNTVIRFGSFTSSSLDQFIARRFGEQSCFEIHTCEGANITKYSVLHYEKEVLIPPYEMFNVTDIKRRDNQNNKIKNKENKLWCKTVFVLNSTGIRSDLNCALFNYSTQKITKYYGAN